MAELADVEVSDDELRTILGAGLEAAEAGELDGSSDEIQYLKGTLRLAASCVAARAEVERLRLNQPACMHGDELDIFMADQARRDPSFATSFLNAQGLSLLRLWLDAVGERREVPG